MFTFSWHRTSLRVGGRAAGRSCLPGLCRGGGRLAGAAVLSCLVWPCEVDNCCWCVQTSNFLSATILSRRESRSHRRSGRDGDRTVLSCLAWRCESALTDSYTPATAKPRVSMRSLNYTFSHAGARASDHVSRLPSWVLQSTETTNDAISVRYCGLFGAPTKKCRLITSQPRKPTWMDSAPVGAVTSLSVRPR